MCLRLISPRLNFKSESESGNVFLAIFGAIALVGLLGASIMTFMKGPLSTSVKLTKINTAENQMQIGSQVAVMATANQANNGDCDSDGYVEPIEWRAATTEPIPIGGGLVPLSLGISKKDPWGTEYGYCVWNHGTSTLGSGCGTNMLQGTNSKVYPVVALISAGPDKTFTTTCREFATSDANHNGLIDDGEAPLVSKAAETDDDIITTYTYEEATGASGGLWSIKAGSPGVAVINKSIESSGVANLKGGVLLPDKSLITCDASNAGVMAKSATGIEICDGAGVWKAISGGSSGKLDDETVQTDAMCDSTAVGQMRYNTGGSSSSGGVSFVGSSSGHAPGSGGDSSLTLSIPVPSGTAAGNILLYAISSDGCGTLTWPSGFTQIQRGDSSAPDGQCWAIAYKIATGSETNLNFNDSTSWAVSGSVVAYSGVDTTSPINASIKNNSSASAGPWTVTSNGLTTTANNARLVWFAAADPDGPASGESGGLCSSVVTAYTPPSGFTERVDIQGTLNSYTCYNPISIADMLKSTAGATGTLTGAFTSSGGGTASTGAILVALKPSSSSPPSSGTGLDNVEVCDGASWKSVTTLTDAAELSITPASNNVMNVDGANNLDTTTCTNASGYSCGAGQTFSVKNQGGTTSQTISVSLTDPTNFVITADTCSGGTLAESASCTVVVKPKANGNTSYTSNLQINANNNPFAIMQGKATNFGCVTGRAAPGGYYAACGLSSGVGNYNLVITPGNCTSTTTNPVCNGAVDTLQLSWGANGYAMPYEDSNGAQGTANIMATANMIGTAVPAVAYCYNLIYGGYDDWYLPAYNELVSTIFPVRAQLTGFSTTDLNTANDYWVSTVYNATDTTVAYWMDGVSSATGYTARNNTRPVRCVRRDGLTFPSATADVNPDDVNIGPKVVFSSGASATSNAVTISGIYQTISASISGGAGMNIIKNGASTGSTSISGVKAGDTLSFQMNGPVTVGTKTTATITIGTDTYSWWVGYADNTRTVKVFVNNGSTGSKGGVTGADDACNAAAAASPYGLSGSWKAILSSSGENAIDRIPWNWGNAVTVTGTSIVDGGIEDMFDGALDTPLNVKADGSTYNGYVHTGSSANGVKYYSNGQTAATFWCDDWTNNNYYGRYTTVGNSASATQAFYYTSGESQCSYGYGTYCIEDIDTTSDVTPAAMTIPYNIQVDASSRQLSTAVTVSGMSSGASTTLSVAATGGTPTFKINGGSEVTSGTVKNGDSIVFLMDAPSTGNSSNKMTVTANSVILGYWRVWTGDSTGNISKRIFPYNFSSSPGWGNMGGISGADSYCQSAANSASLGGTWKAILSGKTEPEWAINRIGYNWSRLVGTDGVDIVMSGNIWKTGTIALLSPPVRNAANTANISTNILTNTTPDGRPVSITDAGTCGNYSNGNDAYTLTLGSSGAGSGQWIQNGNSQSCGYQYYAPNYIYCIEQ